MEEKEAIGVGSERWREVIKEIGEKKDEDVKEDDYKKVDNKKK